MIIEEKLKNHFGSKRDLKWDKIHMTMNKVFFLFVLLLSSIITAQNKEGITQERNNPSFYFDLGVDNDQKGNISLAKDYYLKTIELDPTFEPVYLNLVSLILQGETDIVKEMNGLGSTIDDNKRYDQLTKMRENLYLECVNLLEKYIFINGNNGEANQTLLNIYRVLGNNEGVKRMKQKILQ